MHETGIALEVLKIAAEEAQKNDALKVLAISVKVGRWSGVEPQTLEFALGAVSEGTIAEGCKVVIEVIEPTFDCHDCGEPYEAETRFDSCPRCGGPGGALVSGDELHISELEIE